MRGLVTRIVLVFAVACTGSREPSDPSAVVVPPQPKPAPAPPPPAPATSASATPVAANALPFKCDTGKRFDVSSRAYCAYESPDTWEASEARCVANGGHLMTLDSGPTSNAMRVALGSPIGAGRAAWIGLEGTKTKTKQRDWKWITGEALTTPSWKTNEPNDWDGTEGCAELLTAYGQWNDTRCNLKQGYLCQAKPNTKLTCPGKAFDANGVSYCLNAREKNYADAKRACVTDGGTLAVLKTVEENNHVKNAIAARVAAHRMWIGLTDAAEEGTWTWSSGASFSWSAWHPGEPNDFNGENCVELFSDTWTWNDRDCTLALPSVCEGPKKK